MSNVHGFHNLNSARAGPVGRVPQPAQSRFAPQQQSLPGGYDGEETGISMMQPKPRPDGLEPSLSQRIFPGITWMAMTTFVTLLDVALFVITLIVGGAKFDGAFVEDNKMGGPSATTLCNMGGKWEPSIRDGHVWRLFTAILLHAGVMHIASNAFFQLRFGYITEQRWGSGRWTAIYVLAGLMSSLWSTVMGPTNVSVGASGALFGIVGADFAYLIYNWAQIPHNRMGQKAAPWASSASARLAAGRPLLCSHQLDVGSWLSLRVLHARLRHRNQSLTRNQRQHRQLRASRSVKRRTLVASPLALSAGTHVPSS